VDDNGLKSFSFIQRLEKLSHLFSNSNRISDLADIEKLAELQKLKELELAGNALTRRPGYRQNVLRKITTLLFLDGVVSAPQFINSQEVSQEEKELLEHSAVTDPA